MGLHCTQSSSGFRGAVAILEISLHRIATLGIPLRTAAPRNFPAAPSPRRYCE
jgi:hypothetical protein